MHQSAASPSPQRPRRPSFPARGPAPRRKQRHRSCDYPPTNDLTATFAYNPASQIASAVRTGDAYAWTGHFNQNVTGTANGLNQLTGVGPKSLTHDARGNVTAFGTRSFTYSSENLLATGPNSTTLAYDPMARLHQIVSGGTTTRLAYDGLDRLAEHDGSNNLLRRYGGELCAHFATGCGRGSRSNFPQPMWPPLTRRPT